MRAIEKRAAVALIGVAAACGGGTPASVPVTAGVGSAAMPPEAAPAASASAPLAVSAAAVTPVAPPSSSANGPLPPPRPATIPLTGRDGSPGDAELTAGDEAFERGDLDAAAKSYAAARVAAPKRVAPAVGLARVKVARTGVPLDYAAGKGNAAIAAAAADLAKAAKEPPPFGPAFVELGRARLLLGDAPAAIDALKKGVDLLPEEPEAHSQLGVAWLATGHPEQAASELARASDLDPGSGPRHGNLGTALLMSGRTKEALEQYEMHARIDDGDARAHSDLGTALLGTNDLERALSELSRATSLEPQRATFHSNLGYALQQAGRFDRAVAEYHEAIRLDPRLASAWINLATILARTPSTRREAHAALEHAAAVSPDDPRVKANLEELNALEKGSPDAGPGPKFPSSP